MKNAQLISAQKFEMMGLDMFLPLHLIMMMLISLGSGKHILHLKKKCKGKLRG